MGRDLICLGIGLSAGILSGVVGIGGGIIIVPSLILLLGLTQHQAQGTTLALMVPPIGILAAWTYWQRGMVDFRIAGWVCRGFFIGGLFGARVAVDLPQLLLQRLFGTALLIIGIRMLWVR